LYNSPWPKPSVSVPINLGIQVDFQKTTIEFFVNKISQGIAFNYKFLTDSSTFRLAVCPGNQVGIPIEIKHVVPFIVEKKK